MTPERGPNVSGLSRNGPQVPVVQKVYSAMHRINHCPLDSAIGLAMKPRLHERFFACAGDAIFSNFVASPARHENHTCSHP